jgi:O-antigen/teichoic acid export membrane protein
VQSRNDLRAPRIKMQVPRTNLMSAGLKGIIHHVSRIVGGDNLRTAKAKRNIVLLVALKSVSALTSFLLVAITVSYLNPENYGIWLTLSSVISWVSFLDIGLGNGLRNKFAEAIAKGERELAKVYVSTTYAFLGLTIVLAFAAILLVNHFVRWSVILNAPSGMEVELSTLAIIVAAMFLLRILFGLVGVLLLALQSPALNSMIDVVASVLSLAGAYVLTQSTRSSLLYLGITISCTIALVPLMFSVWLFRTRLREFAPSIGMVRFEYAKKLIVVGMQFFVLQAMYLVVFTTSNIIIAQVFEPEEVTRYNIAFKYFGVASMLFSILLLPFWSAYTDAFFRGEKEWIQNSLRRLVRVWLVFGLLVVVMTVAAKSVYSVWVGDSIMIPLYLSVLMAVYVLMTTWCNLFVNFLNGVGKIRLQVYMAIVTGAINIPLAVYFSKSLPIRSGGVILAVCVCLLPLCFLWPIQTRRIISDRASGLWSK